MRLNGRRAVGRQVGRVEEDVLERGEGGKGEKEGRGRRREGGEGGKGEKEGRGRRREGGEGGKGEKEGYIKRRK